ncbi:MAG: hypothetical protein ACK4NN_13405, partial [Rheinheimera sp.]
QRCLTSRFTALGIVLPNPNLLRLAIVSPLMYNSIFSTDKNPQVPAVFHAHWYFKLSAFLSDFNKI